MSSTAYLAYNALCILPKLEMEILFLWIKLRTFCLFHHTVNKVSLLLVNTKAVPTKRLAPLLRRFGNRVIGVLNHGNLLLQYPYYVDNFSRLSQIF